MHHTTVYIGDNELKTMNRIGNELFPELYSRTSKGWVILKHGFMCWKAGARIEEKNALFV